MSVAAVILAAGRATRMGANKMLAALGGDTLIRRTTRAVLASKARPVILVVGHERERLVAALDGLAVHLVANPRYAEGLSTSVIAGIAALPPDAAGVLVCLGDMPLIGADILDAIIDRFAANPAASAVVPAHAGEWGHPVLLARKLFPGIAGLTGDAGARKLLQTLDDVVVLDIEDAAILTDADTPEALAQLRERLGRSSER